MNLLQMGKHEYDDSVLNILISEMLIAYLRF